MLWSENDELFKTLLKKGHGWQALPYAFLKLHGLDVKMPALEIRKDIADAGRFLETYDLVIADLVIEVNTSLAPHK